MLGSKMYTVASKPLFGSVHSQATGGTGQMSFPQPQGTVWPKMDEAVGTRTLMGIRIRRGRREPRVSNPGCVRNSEAKGNKRGTDFV